LKKINDNSLLVLYMKNKSIILIVVILAVSSLVVFGQVKGKSNPEIRAGARQVEEVKFHLN